ELRWISGIGSGVGIHRGAATGAAPPGLLYRRLKSVTLTKKSGGLFHFTALQVFFPGRRCAVFVSSQAAAHNT
ncbi:hypothetical protein N656DRAFT_782117, partial [Canariomyces notabilis]